MANGIVNEPMEASFDLASVAVEFVGDLGGWFDLTVNGSEFLITPTGPLPHRCVLRPIGFFCHTHKGHEFADANTVMGQLLFQSGATAPQSYRPFSFDPSRRLESLCFMVQTAEHDSLHQSKSFWLSYGSLCSTLFESAGLNCSVPPTGTIDELLSLEPWLHPLEGCSLYALARLAAKQGRYVVEIGSLRGQSTSMLAMALRDASSDLPVVSIDPHSDRPSNLRQVRLTLQHIGEEKRLVQICRSSASAHDMLRTDAASLVFVDGDHSYSAVVSDFECYRHLVVPGGFLAFHDYGYGSHNGSPDVVPDVRRAIDEHLMDCSSFRPILLAHTLIGFQRIA